MTTDEAITILRTTVEENLFDGKPTSDTQKRLYEAMLMGEEALKREQWIPCKDRLPEQDVPVLVQKNCSCLVDGHYGRAVGEYNGFKYWTVEDDFYAEPIAWMPLPEPYKESK